MSDHDSNEPHVERDWPGVGGETPESLSLDPFAGGTANDKIILNVAQVAANLNRSGDSWYLNNYGELDDGILNFGYWANYQELANSYYVNIDRTSAFSEAFDSAAFSVLNAGQQTLLRKSIGLWDDLVAISFQETKSFNADIVVGNTDTGRA